MASLGENSDIVAADARFFTDLTNTRIQLMENGGMFMISSPLNRNNWLIWSRSVRIALEGKDRLGFIDGSIQKPVEGTPVPPVQPGTDHVSDPVQGFKIRAHRPSVNR
ncbi:UNVERIFIED_CONTAM: hypothetical protein Sradi_2956900 [Sesamum radiatum]|uniref:Retrotransposon Copia-like N-terminal domain-containing protein n=1 Tax=Sesamum radiatum TaxID=300843 RepID=A0AAW2RZC7_SESRA